MIGYIYLITDTTNGKQYVGQHHYDKEELDSNYHGSGHIIKNIYSKRPQTLKEEYIKTCYSQTELDEWEKYFIFTFDTIYPNGYNLRDGGNGKIFSDETKRKIGESHKGKHPSEETRRKMSSSRKGEKNHNYGKHLSEETRKKLSISNKGKPSAFKGKHHSEESRRKLSEAQKKYVGEKHQMFGKHHSEETKKKLSDSHKGLLSGEKHPMFGKHHSEETKKKLSDSHKGKQIGEDNPFFGKHHKEETLKKLSKVILQFTLDGELIREWPSLSECTRNGFFQSSVCRCCQGKSTQYKGFVWKYKD